MSKEAYYFSHDSNARNDPKILAMRSEYGITGYGVYWVIVEMLREQDEFKLPLKKYIWNAIAMQMDANARQNILVHMQIDAKEYAKQFVEFCIDECDLFESDGEFFWSNSLIKRMEKKNVVSEKRRAAAQKRWGKAKSANGSNDLENDGENANDANAMQVYANAMQTDAIKGNKIKRNIKENKTTTTIINYPAMIVQFWDDNGFGFNNINAKTKLLGDWYDEPQFKEPGPIVLKALGIAADANKRNKRFVEGILRNWFNAGCATLADVEAYQLDFEQNGGAKREINGPSFETASSEGIRVGKATQRTLESAGDDGFILED